jgi:cytochrome c biogenesis protein CcmG, thiol:disulfide interchange protein DsbE
MPLTRRQALVTTLAWSAGMAHAAKPVSAVAGLRLPVVRPAQSPLASPPWVGVQQLGADDFKGQWVYLDFWASWCAPCRQSFPWMNTLHDRFGPRGLQIVAVSLDKTAERMNAFLKATQPRFWILWDAPSVWAEKLQINSMPSSVLIRPDGQMGGWHRGYTQESARQVEAQLSQWLPERA